MLSPNPAHLRHARQIEHVEEEVVQRRLLRVHEMAVALDLAVRIAAQHNRQIVVRVNVRLAQAAAEHGDRMIEQRAVAVGRVLQPLHQVREERGVDTRRS